MSSTYYYTGGSRMTDAPNGSKRPHVVILGGGFAGIYTAQGLKESAVDITLVDRRNHHLFQPMLYQVATAALAPESIAYPIRRILRGQKHAEVVLGEAVQVDVDAQRVELSDGTKLHYDYLVVGTGARHSYFGRNEWETLAPGLKSLDDALDIRRRVLVAFELAEREQDPIKRHAHLTFVVVGGGPTGVEMAGAIAEIRNFALAKDFRHIDPREATVLLLEGGKRILSGYAEEMSDKAKQELKKIGVEVRTETLVTDITDRHVNAGGWTIPTRTVIWAAGNQASPLIATLGCDTDRAGRAMVEPDCTIAGHPEVFVLGDATHFKDPQAGVLPGICPVAIQMGQYCAKVIDGDLRGKARRPFAYWDKGTLAVIGRGQAVAQIGAFSFSGFFAWLIWAFVHVFFLIGFRNRIIVMIEWAWAYVTMQRGSRVFMGGAVVKPSPKWESLAAGIVVPPDGTR